MKVVEIDFDREGYRAAPVVRQEHGFFIIAGHQVGVGDSIGGDRGIFPRTAHADRLA